MDKVISSERQSSSEEAKRQRGDFERQRGEQIMLAKPSERKQDEDLDGS